MLANSHEHQLPINGVEKTPSGLGAGYFGGILYSGVSGAFGGMKTVCHLLQAGEQTGLLTNEQRNAIVDEFEKSPEARKGQASDPRPSDAAGVVSDAMKSDCNMFKPQ